METLSKHTDIFTGEEIQPEFDGKKIDFEKELIMNLIAQIKKINQITITFNKSGD